MTRLEGHGLAAELPAGWDGQVYRRADEVRAAVAGAVEAPVLHAATFALPAERGDYGGGAVELMGDGDVFVSLFEFAPGEASEVLFEQQGVPQLSAASFDPNAMQRPLPGQSGCQRFFRVGDRGFCLFVALGSHTHRAASLPTVNRLLASLQVG